MRRLLQGFHTRDLHHVEGKSDWANVPPEERTLLQNVAASTKGWLTLGNLVTLTGVVLTVAGLEKVRRGKVLAGLGWIAVGRTADLLDGWIASRTKTKSEIGAGADAAADKFLMAYALLVLGRMGAVPPELAAAIGAEQAAIAGVTVLRRKQGVEMSGPGESGKNCMATAWAYVGGAVARFVLGGQQSRVGRIAAGALDAANAVTAAGTLAYGAQALQEYWQVPTTDGTPNLTPVPAAEPLAAQP